MSRAVKEDLEISLKETFRVFRYIPYLVTESLARSTIDQRQRFAENLKTFAILLWQGMECPYSKDSSGCVPAEEIKLRECLVKTKINMSPFDRFVLMHLPGKITYKEIDEMIRTVDKNEDGKISYSEFRVKMEIDKITVIQFKQEKMKGRFHSFLVSKATLEVAGHDQWVCKLHFSISSYDV